MSEQLKELLVSHIRKVKDVYEHVKGNEQATKQALIGPVFSILGYDLTDPRECIPEFKVDFGPGRSNKPVDWAFFINSKPVFFVEAKDAGKKISLFDEQLSDYYAKCQEVKLGILTNGINWRFFTDLTSPNIMDKEPFLIWDVLSDENIPTDVFSFLIVIQKSVFNPENIKLFAQNKVKKHLLINELNKLLEPSSEFIKLAVRNIESRQMTANVVDYWKDIVRIAIQEWAKLQNLTNLISQANTTQSPNKAIEKNLVITTDEELEVFEIFKSICGDERPIQFVDNTSYFKIHIQDKPSKTIARFFTFKKGNSISIPLSSIVIENLSLAIKHEPIDNSNWVSFFVNSKLDIYLLKEAIHVAYDSVK